ncbi:MAG: hypothetical protein Q8R18_01735 [bacterium]|nr:hypothetical protein [bacterium]
MFKDYFPLRAYSLLEFMRFVDEERVSYVKIIPTVKPTMDPELDKISLGRSYIMGNIDTYGYSNNFFSRNTTNRILFYEEFYGARVGTDFSPIDMEERDKYAISLFLTAQKRLGILKERFPNLDISIRGKNGDPFEISVQEKMLALALEQGIHPFENVLIKEPVFLEVFLTLLRA